MTLMTSSSPHVHGGDSVDKVMLNVIKALAPATLLSIFLFGWPALLVIVLTVLSCVVMERLTNMLRGRPSTIGDYSAILTGLLLALTLPPHSPWWICVVGGVFAIGVGKSVYGGLGYNMFNPALIARVFLLISFPVQLTTWPQISPLFAADSFSLAQSFSIIFAGDYGSVVMDSITAATPLGHYRIETGLGKSVAEALGGDFGFSFSHSIAGDIGGSLGETSALALVAGGIWMIRKGLITWHIPVSMILGTVIPATVMWLINGDVYPDPLFHLVTGGLLLGAFFMATDMVTSPVTPRGMLIFGGLCGVLTYVIRTWGGYPEGVSFAVVIMNTAVPLIDQYTKPVVYGKSKKEKANA
ncbi:electron transport complex, RnfABCDGE type, D subunit [Magnetococcus marinus MC-1]|uniref:Ion-translocating oxidoreductase complex subunit D n=1 Tax=Magnetococcus marinus (strain ATCC BAA-1437 / JCM 17883 / MC-1) TaxID=156889 RepID=A0L5G5_MAGMM|nr:RnfABCDGE type electron transport complex subunit D [Magnetococcus marinus]ABK43208.1 electron transport complex, RnfABCDGE type, D subunit [Magnetococcus marinus MC-1]